MARYICTQKSFHNLKLFRVGDIFNGSPDALPKDKKGDVRGFRLLDGDPPPKPAAVVVKVNDKVAGETETVEEPASTKAAEEPRPRPKPVKLRKGFVPQK